MLTFKEIIQTDEQAFNLLYIVLCYRSSNNDAVRLLKMNESANKLCAYILNKYNINIGQYV